MKIGEWLWTLGWGDLSVIRAVSLYAWSLGRVLGSAAMSAVNESFDDGTITRSHSFDLLELG